MKRRIAFILALTVLVLMSSAYAEARVLTTSAADLRKGPGMEYRPINTVAEGTRLSYDRTSEDALGTVWYRVRVNGRTGWISSLCAQRDEGSDGQVTATNDVKLRSGPGADYASRAVVAAGTTLDYDGIAEDYDDVLWYRVTYSGKRGWISSRAAQPGIVSITGRVATLVDIRLRSGPGSRYGSQFVLPGSVTIDYDRVEMDEQCQVWCRVHFGEWTGWVPSSDVRQVAGDADLGHRILTTGTVHLHTRPSGDSISMDALEAGLSLNCDRTEEDEQGLTWYHVSYNGMKGWISSRYAEPD